MLHLHSLPSYGCVSGIAPDWVDTFLDPSTTDIQRWRCKGVYRGSECSRTLLVYTLPTRGVQLSKCERCGHLNVMLDGVPLK